MPSTGAPPFPPHLRLCKKGLTFAPEKTNCITSEELQQRGYIVYKAPEQQWCSGQYSLCLDREAKAGKIENQTNTNNQTAKP